MLDFKMEDKEDFLECLDMAIAAQALPATGHLDALASENDLFLYLKEVSTPADLLARVSAFDLSVRTDDSLLGGEEFPRGTSVLMYLLRAKKELLASTLLNWAMTEEGAAGRCLLGLQDSNGMSALMLAAQGGFFELVRSLAPYEACLQMHSEAHIKCSGTKPSSWVSGKTALVLAVEARHFDVALFLSTYESGMFFVLERHVRNTDRTKTVFIDHLFALDILESISQDLENDPHAKNLSDALDLDRWMRAAVTKDITRLIEMAPGFLGKTNGLGQTAIMIACCKDQVDSIRALIRYCPEQFRTLELSKHDVFDNNALCYATLMKSVACVTLLSAYNEAHYQNFSLHRPDERNIASRWNGKGVMSCLGYAQSIGFCDAYPLLSEPLCLSRRL